MFLFVLAKLLPERHNLYGNSLDFKLKYMREKKTEGKMEGWKKERECEMKRELAE